MLPKYNREMPRSQTSSGCELGPECASGEIQQAEAGKGLDQAVRKIDSGRKPAKDETRFTSETTSHASLPNGPSGLPLMSPAGEKLAAKSAPRNAFVTREKITTSAVDKLMRGGR